MTGRIDEILDSLADAISAATPVNGCGVDDTFRAVVDIPDESRTAGPRTVWVFAIPSRRPEGKTYCDRRETTVTILHGVPDTGGGLKVLLRDADTILDAIEAWGGTNAVTVTPALGAVEVREGWFVASRDLAIEWDRT